MNRASRPDPSKTGTVLLVAKLGRGRTVCRLSPVLTYRGILAEVDGGFFFLPTRHF